MKMKFKSLLVFGACLAAGLLLTPRVSAQTQGFYIKADVGGNITVDTDLKSFFGPVTPGSKVKFDPGVRLGFAGGYQFCEFFAMELETGFMANTISSITEASQLDASFANAPFLVNARFQLPRWQRVSPYIGGGVGGSSSIISSDVITINGTTLTGDDATVVFAWQAFAGLRFKINERMGISAEYHYFGTEAPSWDADFTSGTSSSTLKFGGAQTHSFSVAFDFNF